MRQKPVGVGRITFGVMVAVLLFFSVVVLGTIGDTSSRSIPIVWTNPDSGLQTTISSNWEARSQTAEDGAKSTLLLNTSVGEQILVGLESSSSISVEQYVQALSRSLSTDATISNWTSANNGQAMMATGNLIDQQVPLDLYVYKVGNRFWRVISFDLTGRASGHFIDQATHAAIVQTFN